jgi:acetyl-CoA carboxylase biotin carboxyl carrier protein
MKADDSEKTKGKKGGTDRSYDIEEVRDLADLFDERGLTELEFENENVRVRFAKMTAAPFVPAPQPMPLAPQATGSAVSASTEDAGPAASTSSDLHKITSPIVGTFYRSPGPDKDPYVSEGSKVSPESVVCIVEAMKLMNEIQAETSGEIVEIYVENGQPVEFGQPLFGIKK